MKDLYTGNLFATESNLKIMRLTGDDVLEKNDRLRLFLELTKNHEAMYPDIERWMKEKVLPGIRSGERVAYIGLNNEKPVVSAIAKHGAHSKFCHLHIDVGLRDLNIGNLFFAMLALDVKRFAKEVHFTLPESLWIEKESFFQSFGFQRVKKSETQYRTFEEELKCSASFDLVWSNVLDKLPKLIESLTKSHDNIFNGLLVSIKPKYISKIERGDKIVEIRKRFSKKWQGCRATLYSTSPVKAIYGYATIEKIRKDTPEKIWSQYGEDIGGIKRDFDKYVGSSKEIYAIFLNNYNTYLNSLDLEHMSYLLNYKKLKPPQSYLCLEKDTDWTKAVSIAELLHNRFWLYEATPAF